MTSKQAIKHKEVIKWWLDNIDKGVWVKEYGTDWELLTSEYSVKFYLGASYVQNDEYAELRKAQADGKIIELQCKTGGDKSKWLIKTKTTRDFNEGYFYRIRPDEHKFKEGDWVRTRHGIDKIDSIHSNKTAYFQRFKCYQDLDKIELWQPQEGDVVVCWNSSSFSEQRTIIEYIGDDTWENIIPYIGQDLEDMR